MRIIPAIDIIDGNCVRLTQGDYDQKKIYHEDPLEVAMQFEAAGLKYLHLVDLDGARAGKIVNWAVIEKLGKNSKLRIDFGGGIKTDADIRRLFDSGMIQINVGSIALKDPEKVKGWINIFGAGRVILSADVRNEYIAISGWQENSTKGIFDLLGDYVSAGLQYVTCTDISTDGTLKGPNLALYEKISRKFPGLSLIASGGVGSKDDVLQLKEIPVDGVIIGKALYERKITLEELTGI